MSVPRPLSLLEVDPGDEVPGIAGAAIYECICIGCKAKDEFD